MTSDRVLMQLVSEKQNAKNMNYESNCRHRELRESIEDGQRPVAVNFPQRVRKDRMKRTASLIGIPVETFRQGFAALKKGLM